MNSWSNRLARPLVRPLVGTGVTPNHLTSLRLAIGLATFLLLSKGEPGATWWAGWTWILTVFLDYADGELARVGNMASPAGHAFDYAVDVIVNSLFFLGVGIGLRHSAMGWWSVGLGLEAGACILLASLWSEAIARRGASGGKAYSGIAGFNFDDLSYLLAPLAWLDWLRPTLFAAAGSATCLMLLTAWRLRAMAKTG